MLNSMTAKNKFITTVSGTVAIALCCFTPVLVVAFAGIGLGAVIPYLDFMLFPALFLLSILSFISYKRWKQKDSNAVH